MKLARRAVEEIIFKVSHAFDVDGINLQRKFSIVYHKNKFLTQSARGFIDLCKNYELDFPIPKYNGLY